MGMTSLSYVYADHNDHDHGGGDVQYVRCESQNYRLVECGLSGRVLDVSVYSQYSNSPCIEGSSFGAHHEHIWVNSGCRATFRVVVESSRTSTTRIICESSGYRYNTCFIGDRVRDVRLVRQLSNTACIENSSFGIGRNYIWVDRGCRGEFEVLQGGWDRFGHEHNSFDIHLAN